MQYVQPIQDAISFALVAETTIVNETVKVTATISAIVTPEMTEARLKEEIKKVFANFIKNAPWQFSGMIRGSHSSGMEEITINATARVPESENYALEQRARKLSVNGLTITDVNVDTSPPYSMIEEAEGGLRLKLLEKAQTELQAINKKMGTDYRLGVVNFGNTGHNMLSNRQAPPKGIVAQSSLYGSGFSGGDEDSLGNAVKLSMTASITLQKIVPIA